MNFSIYCKINPPFSIHVYVLKGFAWLEIIKNLPFQLSNLSYLTMFRRKALTNRIACNVRKIAFKYSYIFEQTKYFGQLGKQTSNFTRLCKQCFVDTKSERRIVCKAIILWWKVFPILPKCSRELKGFEVFIGFPPLEPYLCLRSSYKRCAMFDMWKLGCRFR